MIKKKTLILLTLLIIFTIIPIFTNNTNINNIDGTLKTSTDNYLFNGKEYDMTLDDVYDDENTTKIYTGANFQSVFLENESTTLSEVVSPVNNINYKRPSNTDVSMIDGTFDDTDNMKVNEDSYSNFTSIEDSDYQGTYSFKDEVDGTSGDDIVFINTDNTGAGCNVQVISEFNGHSKVLKLTDISAVNSWNFQNELVSEEADGTIELWYARNQIGAKVGTIQFLEGATNLGFLMWNNDDLQYYDGATKDIKLDFIVANTWYHLKIIFDDTANTYEVYIDGTLEQTCDYWHSSTTGLDTFKFVGNGNDIGYDDYMDAIGYSWDPNYDIGDNLILPIPAKLNYTIDLNFNEVLTEDFLALDISSYHHTNISTDIIGNIYNYDSSSYTQMFNSSNTVETLNYFMDDTIPTDYLNPSGNLRLCFTGTNSVDFKQIIDYIKVRFYYKMDLTHTISFETNGLWKYRWELIGSLQYTDWTYFEVVDPVPNFHAISGSDYTTRWILQGADISPVEDFHDDINTDYWNLVDVSDIDFNYQEISSKDSHVRKYYPNNNYGTESYISVVASSIYERYSYLYFTDLNSNYLFLNQTGANKISLYKYDSDAGDIEIYNTTSFDEYTITWNNAPVGIDMLDSISNSGTGWKYWTVPYLNEYYMIKFSAESDLVQGNFRSREYASNNPVFIRNDVSKNYFGSGYMYMQTNTTELIGLKSQDYTTHYSLSSGNYFEVDFQTSSDSEISLILLKDGVVNKTLILSGSGNTNFNRHTVQLSVDEFVEFDQLKISSTFGDEDYVKVYDIKTYKYTLTGDYADFVVGSRRTESVYLTPDTYNLKISDYSSGHVYVNENVTIGSTNFYKVFTPTATKQCRISFFNPDNVPLIFTDYHVSINRSLGGSYSQFALLENIFSVDIDTTVYVNISDRFNTLIRTYEKRITPTTDYLDIELEVYSLQIKNLMEQRTTLDINSTHTFPLLSGELIEYILSKNYYEIGYYDTDNDYHQFITYLNSNQAFELNRSKICFLSYADQQGNHLSFDNYKTYINGSMIYEQIFYEDAGDDVNITITDRYNYQVYSGIYSVVSGDNFIPITLTMYSLKVMNQQEAFNHINITRDPNYYDSEYYWSEWIAPNEIVEFKLFAGHYVFNLTDTENGWSSYGYELNGDDVLLMSSDNIISNVIYNIANVNTTIGNQITNVQIDLTNQNSDINNTIINIDINLSNVNSSLGTLLTNINLDITNINNNISNLYTFTENNFLNLGNNINNSFILIENNIIAINQTISTLVIGLDGKVTIVNATINTMFTEMNSQFIITQSTLDYSFSFLNQTIIQIGNNITTNQIALNNLIIQRANEIDNSLIQISTLVNLINSSVVNESLVIQSLVNIIGNNITENHIIINDLINLIGNNITENNINMVNIIELVGNNITTNHFVIQTLIDYVSNNISDNHLEVLTNINFINTTIGQNQIELINRLLFINNSINTMALDLTNQILLVNNTIYSAILDVYTSIEFNSDNILGNISLTYQQNDFLTELYKETMFSQLLNWSDVAYNYSLMEDRIDVWDFINNYRNDSITVFLKYGDLIDNLTITAQNSIEQYLPNEDVEYRLWSVASEEYLNNWTALPNNMTVGFGFYDEVIPEIPDFNAPNTILMIILIVIACIFPIVIIGYLANRYRKKSEVYRKSYADKITLEAQTISKFSQGRRIK